MNWLPIILKRAHPALWISWNKSMGTWTSPLFEKCLSTHRCAHGKHAVRTEAQVHWRCTPGGWSRGHLLSPFAECSLHLQRCLCAQTHIHTMLVSLAHTKKGCTHPDDAILLRFWALDVSFQAKGVELSTVTSKLEHKLTNKHQRLLSLTMNWLLSDF
jgi:hypothetical protein